MKFLRYDAYQRRAVHGCCESGQSLKFPNVNSHTVSYLNVVCSFISLWLNCKFMEFFNVSKFKEYEMNFPDILFKSIMLFYGKYFEFIKLKSELVCMYSTPDFHLKSINCLKKLIIKNKLKDVPCIRFNSINLHYTFHQQSVQYLYIIIFNSEMN